MSSSSPRRTTTGIMGLDEILGGGLIPSCSYLLRGGPGTGKTTVGLHFLSQGAEKGERTLLITLSEPASKIRGNALGRFNLDGVNFLDLTPSADDISGEQDYTIFSPYEVEQEPVTNTIINRIRDLKPARVFLDCVAYLRYLSADAYQFRKQMLLLTGFALSQGATLLLSSESSPHSPDDDLQFLCDGVINLDVAFDERSVQVSKLRGSDFQIGTHSLKITKSGIIVYPRLVPRSFGKRFEREAISSGVRELDKLLHGGIERGTATVISGPTGVGKTTLGLQFMKEAANRGERSVVYTFEEGVESLAERCESINIPIGQMIKRGTLSIVKVDPLEFSPDEFSHLVREEVETSKAKIVMIDSVSGYSLSFREPHLQQFAMARHLHSLSEYLKNMGVTALLINEVQSITGEFRVTDHGFSYLADNVVFLRYFEVNGEIHKTIGVLKKRLSDFEKGLRRLKITGDGLKVGEPLYDLRGILTGHPETTHSDKREG